MTGVRLLPPSRVAAALAALTMLEPACGGDDAMAPDSTAPALLGVTVTPTADVFPGDTLSVRFTAADNVGLAYSVVQVSGAFTARDSAAHGGGLSASRDVRIRVPDGARNGIGLTIAVDVVDLAGNDAHGAASIQYVGEIGYPTVGGRVAGEDTTGVGVRFVPGDTLGLTLFATDNRRLAWVGYRCRSYTNNNSVLAVVAQDSFAVNGPAFNRLVEVGIARTWLGTGDVLVWARDSVGNWTESRAANLQVIDAVRRPTTTLKRGVRDVAYDVKRGLLYLSQPDSQRVAVVALATGTFGAAIAVPGRPHGLDLTAGGDSLVVALNNRQSLAIVDLRGPAPVLVDTLHVTSSGGGPDVVVVTANGRAIVAFAPGGNLSWYDLRNATQGTYPSLLVGERAPLARTRDRTRAIFVRGECCPTPVYLYFEDGDSLMVRSPGTLPYALGVSADSTGAAFLAHLTLLDADLNVVRTFGPLDCITCFNALTGDAAFAYFGVGHGYSKIRTADGALREQVVLPVGVLTRLLLIDGDQRLIAVTGQRAVIVDLQ